MNNFKKNIDKLVSKILNEEIEKKVQELSEEVGEWTEIEIEDELKGNQKKLDVAEPKGKLTAADFKKLRSKKSEMEEHMYYDDLSDLGDYEGDEDEEEEAEMLSQQEPTYVGRGLSDNKPSKMFGSFDDEHGWYDEQDRHHTGDFDFDFDEEEFDEFEPFDEKYGKKQKWFGSGEEGKKFFDMYKEKFEKPFKVRTKIFQGDMDEEVEEGNKFSGELENARKEHKKSFEVDGKTYPVKEAKEKWIQKTKMHKGALHKKLDVPEGEKIPKSKLKSLKAELQKKAEGDKKLSASDAKLLKQVNLALTLKDIKEDKNSLKLSENELIDLIENIVIEQKVKDKSEKENISKKSPEGLKKTQKVLDANKKENEDYAKEVVKKMKDYVKQGTKGEYKESPENFPESNYTLEKNPEVKKYMPSDAVEEYIEYFSYPGMTNLVFDEIKPNDENIEKYIKGHRTTGNAEFDEDGKALGNVVPSEVGERFFKNYKENVYGNEQQKASYKRQSQPVEVAGEKTSKGSLKTKKGLDKGAAVLNKLEESRENKKNIIISEEMEKMKNLISYNRKTQ